MPKRTAPAGVQMIRVQLRQLAEQLAVEYAGAVPAGRVMSLVFTTGHRLQQRNHDHDDLLRLTNSSVRAALSTLVGQTIAHGLISGESSPRDTTELLLAHS